MEKRLKNISSSFTEKLIPDRIEVEEDMCCKTPAL
jgi:hypothetical protein